MTDESSNQRKTVTVEDIIRRHTAEAFPAYFDWLKQLVTLSSLQLTVLLALADIPGDTSAAERLALLATWICLSTSVLTGVFACSWQYKGPLKSAQRLLDASLPGREDELRSLVTRFGSAPPLEHRLMAGTTVLMFCAANAFLCAYGIAKIF